MLTSVEYQTFLDSTFFFEHGHITGVSGAFPEPGLMADCIASTLRCKASANAVGSSVCRSEAIFEIG